MFARLACEMPIADIPRCSPRRENIAAADRCNAVGARADLCFGFKVKKRSVARSVQA